jgi:hypothetical protein
MGMNAPIQRAERSSSFDSSTTHLDRRWLLPVRVIWLVLTFFALLVFVVNLPVYYQLLQELCRSASCVAGQLNPNAAQAFHNVGLSLSSYALLRLTLAIIYALVWFAVGGVLAWRKSDDWMALLVSIMLVMQGAANITSAVSAGPATWPILVESLNFCAFVLLFLVFIIFPNGRFVPRWTYWFVVIFSIISALYNFFPMSPFNESLITNAIWLACIGAMIVIQVYRYSYVSNRVQRQQTKWVVFGVVVVVGSNLLSILISLIVPSLGQPGSFYSLAFGPDLNFFFLLIPLSVGIAILRYRLYDIDIIINRTLVYGTLTAALALVYFGCVILSQSIVHVLTGLLSDSPLATVASTLAVVALFQPLRGRIQVMIDRRFYRRKYDATKALEAFSATLRDELDISQLSEQLVAVVQETMQPSHISLWVQRSERHKERKK